MPTPTQRILVTGGAGFIGSHTCKALAKSGYEPVVFDNLSQGKREAVRWGPLVEGDIQDRACLERAFREFRPAAVIHFAAHAYVGESVTNPSKYYRNNFIGSLNLMDTVVANGNPPIVFSSTCATYGVPEQVPILEGQRQTPINPYGESKLMIEKALRDYERAYGLRWVALRYFNAAGADPDGELGENHDPETHLIPLVLEVAAGIHKSIAVFGNDYFTPDGTCIRDYIHVRDLAAAHVAALGHLQNGKPSLALNVGTGKGHSVLDVIRASEAVTGSSIPIDYSPRRPGDPPTLVANPSLARATLQWQPEFPEIRQQIEHAWAWIRRR